MGPGEDSYRRYLDGDETAFDGVIAAYYDSLTFFLCRYVKDRSTAEDLTMDTLLELLIHPKRYHFKTKLKTYLFAIGRNKALNALKRSRRLAPDELSEAERAAQTSSPDEELLRREETRELHRALNDLPSDMRAAVHLVYFEEMSYEEAARALHKSRKQIDNLLYRAKTILKRELSKEDFR